MSASAAWAVVLEFRNLNRPSPNDWALYLRACSIVAAKIDEHELTVQLESDPENVQLSLERGRAYLKVRALERGEAQP